MSENGETTASLKRRTLKRVENTKIHPRESFDEAVTRLLEDRAVVQEIARKDPELVDRVRHHVAGAMA
jgi:hypothetical protein